MEEKSEVVKPSQAAMPMPAKYADAIRVLMDAGRAVEPNAGINARIDPIYCTDDYPREGCTLVVDIQKAGWNLRVYAPGFPPVGRIGMIETYMRRPHGSLGIAMEAFFRTGADLRPVMPQMVKAERAYRDQSSDGSSVTS